MSRHYLMGYNCFLSHISRDIGDDLPTQYRPLFRLGWDRAHLEHPTPHNIPSAPTPVSSPALDTHFKKLQLDPDRPVTRRSFQP